MNAMNTFLKAVLLLLLVALSVEQASGQVVDPNPPVVCESDDGGDDGSYIEISGEWKSPEGRGKVRLEGEDVKGWFDMLFGWLRGGETPEGETPEGETPEGETPEGETPEGEGNDGNAEESTGAPDCDTVLQQLRYAKVEIARSHLVATMARSSALNIVEVHLTRPIAIPPRVRQRHGLRGNWFIKPGTYTTTSKTIRLPLVQRRL